MGNRGRWGGSGNHNVQNFNGVESDPLLPLHHRLLLVILRRKKIGDPRLLRLLLAVQVGFLLFVRDVFLILVLAPQQHAKTEYDNHSSDYAADSRATTVEQISFF